MVCVIDGHSTVKIVGESSQNAYIYRQNHDVFVGFEVTRELCARPGTSTERSRHFLLSLGHSVRIIASRVLPGVRECDYVVRRRLRLRR